LVYLGFVTTANNGSAGRMYVRVQNGYEMQELHNVSAQTPSNNDILKYNTTTSLWETSNALSTKQDTITGAASTITSSNLTGSRALVSDGGGKVAVSAVSTTELGRLIGVTSDIQTQLNSKIASSVSFISNIIALGFNGAASPVTRFHSVASGLSALPNPCQIPVPTACTFSNFYFRIYGAQPATGSLVLTLQKNAVDTAVTITIASGSAIGIYSDTSNSASFSAGDTWQLKLVQNATSGSSTLGGYSFKLSGL